MTRDEVIDLAKRKRAATKDDDADAESDDESNEKATVDSKTVQKLQTLVGNSEDVSVSGIDLGIRNVAATVRRTWHNRDPQSTSPAPEYDIHEANILHKSKDYHYEAGFHKRKRLRRKLVGDFDDEYRKDRQNSAQQPSQRCGDYLQFIRSRLKWFNKGTQAYMKRPVVNLNFDKYKSTQIQMTKMAKEIVGEKMVHDREPTTKPKHRIVFVGDCATPANSKIKGHLRSPGQKPLCRYLKQRPNTSVIPQDEFRTTRNCSKCFDELVTVESSKDRLKICSKFCMPQEDSMPANEEKSWIGL